MIASRIDISNISIDISNNSIDISIDTSIDNNININKLAWRYLCPGFPLLTLGVNSKPASCILCIKIIYFSRSPIIPKPLFIYSLHAEQESRAT